jgi:predicted PurR-regulated permease PerM
MPSNGSIRASLVICTIILLSAAAYLASSVFAPLTFAVFILAIVWPLQKSLQASLPKGVALFLTLSVTIVSSWFLHSWSPGRSACIPFIGPFVATLLPGLFALAQLDSWQTIALVFLGLTAIQFMIGNYLEPLVAGAALTISPFAVVFAVFFWGFLWGIPGAFIGVPIMITIVTLCAQYPGSRWVATLLSSKPPDAAPDRS